MFRSGPSAVRLRVAREESRVPEMTPWRVIGSAGKLLETIFARRDRGQGRGAIRPQREASRAGRKLGGYSSSLESTSSLPIVAL